MAMSSIWDDTFRLILSTPIVTEKFTATLNELINDLYSLSSKQRYELRRLGRMTHEKEFSRLQILVEELFPVDADMAQAKVRQEYENSFKSMDIFDNKMDITESDTKVVSIFRTNNDKPIFNPKAIPSMKNLLNSTTKISTAVPISKVIKIEVITDKNGVIKSAKNHVKPKVLRCKRCFKVFTNSLNIKGVHSLHVCKQCHAKYNNLKKISDSLQREHVTDTTPATPIAKQDRTNDWNKTLERYFPTISKFGIDYDDEQSVKDNELVHQCTQCDYSSTIERNLQKHLHVHSNKRDHKCNICDKTFTRSDHLKRHIRIHTGEKPYKCVFCEYSCARSCHLNNHITTHTAGFKPFKCSFCEREFIQTTQLKLHVKTHCLPIERFGCTFCLFEEADVTALIQHTKSNHLSEKKERRIKFHEIKPITGDETQNFTDQIQSTTEITDSTSKVEIVIDNENSNNL